MGWTDPLVEHEHRPRADHSSTLTLSETTGDPRDQTTTGRLKHDQSIARGLDEPEEGRLHLRLVLGG